MFTNLIYFFFLLTPLFAYCQSFTCPTADEVRSGQLKTWLPLYIDNEELVSLPDFALFKKHISAFIKAKWSRLYLENGHCFYQGDHDVFTRIVLAKDARRPVADNSWKWLDYNKTAECFDGTENCGFLP